MENTDSIGEWRRVFAILLSVGSVLFTIPWLAVSALALWQVSAGVFEGGELLMAAIFLTAPPAGLFTFLALLLVGSARCKVSPVLLVVSGRGLPCSCREITIVQ